MSSAAPDSPPSSPPNISKNAENNLQPFFVLHKALPRKPSAKSPSSEKTKRRIDLFPKLEEKSEGVTSKDENDHLYVQRRMEAFDMVWSEIETSVKNVLRRINANLFNGIREWVSESFAAIKKCATICLTDVKRPYPVINDSICNQLYTALVLTKNVEFVDDLLTFEELGLHLKSQGCHVANISSLDFTVKNGLGGCLRSLLRQLISVTVEGADISTLAAWYSEQENYDKPIVVIIDDIERCSGIILAEFIMLLSEWVIKIPIILIMGVATTADVPAKVLPSNALQRLHTCQFSFRSPYEKMDAIIEDVLVRPNSGFNVGHKVAVFLRNYFFKHDGTVTAFIRALKIACIKHFSMEPLSFLAKGTLFEQSQDFWNRECKILPEMMLNYAFELPSCEREHFSAKVGDYLASGLSELKILRENWTSVVMCIYEVGKITRMQLLDILCEVLDPNLQNLKASGYFSVAQEYSALSSSTDNGLRGENCGPRKGNFIAQMVRKVRDLPAASLLQLLYMWGKHTMGMDEVNGKVKELHSVLTVENQGKSLETEGRNMSESISRRRLNMGRCTSTVNVKAALLLECMVRDYLMPMECTPFHEILCFKHVDILQSALIGDPRRTIQVDLLQSHNYLCCSCCSKGGGALLPSMHDTSIMYNLAQEHGDLINLHDWYQAFKTTILSPSSKSKHKQRQSPMPKKRKDATTDAYMNEASIQARFCRAVTELQIAGLLRMPSKRRPDYIQRVAFGL